MNPKAARTHELLQTFRTAGWTNEQFWEAHALLGSISNEEMFEYIPYRSLLVQWTEEEGQRIEYGEHEGCAPELVAQFRALWSKNPTQEA